MTLTEHFQQFWSLYPRRLSKKDAMRAYERAIRDGATPDDILKGLKNYVDWLIKEDTEARFIKHPSTWLNKGCWEDDYNVNIERPKPISREEEMWLGRIRCWKNGAGFWYDAWGPPPGEPFCECPSKFLIKEVA